MTLSIRARLALTLSSVFFVVWGCSAFWIFEHLNGQLSSVLDQRLMASARLVAGLIDQLPPTEATGSRRAPLPNNLALTDFIACEVSSLDGDVLASANLPADTTFNLSREGFADIVYDDEHWRTYTFIYGDYRITTADRQQERDALSRSTLMSAVLPIIATLLICLVMLSLGIKDGLKPLKSMRDALRARKIDSVEPLDIQSPPKELQPLLAAQNALLLRVANAIERERRFTGDAAHELRTPLTAIKTHLQLAQLASGDRQQSALQHAELGADRLQHTLEQLLMLSKVEGSLSFEDGSDYTTTQIATFAIEDAAGQASSRVRLHLSEQAQQAMPSLPSTLAVVALRNLLDNALRYSPPDSPVELNISLSGEFLVFAVRDHGNGINEADLAHLTERFWRNPASKGCGLGLAIVDAIMRRYASHITFANVEQGFVATLNVRYRPERIARA